MWREDETGKRLQSLRYLLCRGDVYILACWCVENSFVYVWVWVSFFLSLSLCLASCKPILYERITHALAASNTHQYPFLFRYIQKWSNYNTNFFQVGVALLVEVKRKKGEKKIFFSVTKKHNFIIITALNTTKHYSSLRCVQDLIMLISWDNVLNDYTTNRSQHYNF